MVFSTLEGHVQFGELVLERMLAFPYSGPDIPSHTTEHLNSSGVRSSLLGVALPNGEFAMADNPMAEYVAAYSAWEVEAVGSLIAVIKSHDASVVLVTDNIDTPPRNISLRALNHVPASRLKFGIFDTLDYRLEPLQAFDKAAIMVSQDIATAYRKTFLTYTSSQNGGRPPHPAKQWYEARNCDRRGMTIKELQRAMPADDKGEPPSESAIRSWEKTFQQKPPAET